MYRKNSVSAAKNANLKARVSEKFKEDPNLVRATSFATSAVKLFPAAAGTYLVDKLPLIRWLPSYSSKWIINDIVAGTTVGLLLIPQSLAYAKIANIPEEFGLMSSWIPPLVYAFMGSSKGPTSIVGVLIAEILKDFHNEGYSPQQISGLMTFLVGVISLTVGLFKLGFLLDLISIPVLSGFVSAAGLLSMLSQVPVLFGNSSHGATSQKLYDIFAKIPEARLYDSLIGLSSIAILLIVEQIGIRWGPKNKVIWAISICRNAILIIGFTIVSYLVNRNVETPYFAISKIASARVENPSLPSINLMQRLFGRSIPIFLAVALEHMAIGTTFGRREGYKIDGSQELVFIGVSNLINGLFPTIPSGGSFSRSAVNTECGVKSPLSNIVTSGFVLFSLYFLTGALYWIPKATLAAVIIIAVASLLVFPSTFYKYWRVSFTDFMASMIAFWVTLFVSVDMGMAFAVGFNILYVVFRIVFSNVKIISPQNVTTLCPELLQPQHMEMASLPEDTLIYAFEQPILFLNAERTKTALLNSISQYSCAISGIDSIPKSDEMRKAKPDRLWCETANKSSDTISSRSTSELPLRNLNVVLDFSHVFHIDMTGIEMLAEALRVMNSQANLKIQCRFVRMQQRVRLRLGRAGWRLQDVGTEDWDSSILGDSGSDAPIVVYQDMQSAVWAGQGKEVRTASDLS